jgi:fucose 4-O-acetylase-like acetyltransferase
VEAFRTIAATMIVWYHAGVGAQEFAYGGLIVFLIISTYLAAQAASRNIKVGLKVKFERLMIPWAFWMVVYGVVNLVLGKPLMPESSSWLGKLLTGTATHLWYMPFIFGTLLLVDVLKNNVSPPLIGVLSGIAAASILFGVSLWRDYSLTLGYPIAQYCHAAAGALIGLFFGCRRWMPKHLFLSLLALLVAGAVYALPWRGVGATYLVGILFGSVLSFEWLGGFNFHFLEKLAPYTLGIYFIHILVLWGVTKLHIPDLFEFALTLLLSAIVVIPLSKRFPQHVRYWA